MIAPAATGIGIVLAGWLCLGTVVAGMGMGMLTLACGRSGEKPDLFRASWVGLAGVVMLAQFWNFVWPLTWPFSLVCVSLATVGWIVGRGGAAPDKKSERQRIAPVFTATLVVVTIWAAHRATAVPGQADAPIYHLSAVRWYAEHPIVVGLANIHDRLGYNNTSHFIHAALERAGFAGRSFHLVNSFMCVLILLRICFAAKRLLKGDADWLVETFYLLILTPTVGVAISNNMSSPSTDWPGMAATFVGTAELLKLLTRRQDSEQERSMAFVVALLTLSVGATFKLTHLPFAVMACGLAVIAFLWRPDVLRALRSRPVVVSVVMCAVLTLTWVFRSVLLSGYAAYPTPASAFPVSWKVPEDQRLVNHLVTIASGRNVLDVARAEDPGWMRPWIRWQFSSINIGFTIVPLVVLGVAILACAATALRRGTGRFSTSLFVLLPLGAATLIWWSLAPQPRMGGFLLWTIAAVVSGASVSMCGWIRSRWVLHLGVIGGVALGLLPIVGWMAAAAAGKIMVDKSRHPVWVRPGPDLGLHPAQVFDVQAIRTWSGLELLTPLHNTGCGDVSLPCTPFPTRQLEQLSGSGLNGGFRVSKTSPPAPTPAEFVEAWRVLRSHVEPGDLVYANKDSIDAVRLAIETGELPATVQLVNSEGRDTVIEMARDLGALAGRGRVWYIHADGPAGPKLDELGSVLYVFDNLGVPIFSHHGSSVSLALRRMLP